MAVRLEAGNVGPEIRKFSSRLYYTYTALRPKNRTQSLKLIGELSYQDEGPYYSLFATARRTFTCANTIRLHAWHKRDTRCLLWHTVHQPRAHSQKVQ
jgi:hypothetical protein